MAKCKCGCGEDAHEGKDFILYHYAKWKAAQNKKNSVREGGVSSGRSQISERTENTGTGYSRDEISLEEIIRSAKEIPLPGEPEMDSNAVSDAGLNQSQEGQDNNPEKHGISNTLLVTLMIITIASSYYVLRTFVLGW